jgi:hypothetical protein
MIRTLLVTALLAGSAVLDAGTAQARTAPWCAVVSSGRGAVYWDCQYASFEACYPNVLSGNRGFCNQNPAYEGPVVTKKKVARRHRSHQY